MSKQPKSPGSIAATIAKALYQRTVLEQKKNTPGTARANDDYIDCDIPVFQPCVTISRSELREMSDRSVARLGFIKNIAVELEKFDVRAEIKPNGDLFCKSELLPEKKTNFSSFNDLLEQNAEDSEKMDWED